MHICAANWTRACYSPTQWRAAETGLDKSSNLTLSARINLWQFLKVPCSSCDGTFFIKNRVLFLRPIRSAYTAARQAHIWHRDLSRTVAIRAEMTRSCSSVQTVPEAHCRSTCLRPIRSSYRAARPQSVGLNVLNECRDLPMTLWALPRHHAADAVRTTYNRTGYLLPRRRLICCTRVRPPQWLRAVLTLFKLVAP